MRERGLENDSRNGEVEKEKWKRKMERRSRKRCEAVCDDRLCNLVIADTILCSKKNFMH